MNPPSARVLPLDIAHARDARLKDAAEHVEPHLIADVDPEALVDALLDRHFEQRRVRGQRTLPRPELAVRDSFVGLEVIAIGDDVLARERPAAPDVLIAVEVDVAARERP